MAYFPVLMILFSPGQTDSQVVASWCCEEMDGLMDFLTSTRKPQKSQGWHILIFLANKRLWTSLTRVEWPNRENSCIEFGAYLISTKVSASHRKLSKYTQVLAKRSRKLIQVFNLSLFASPFRQGLRTQRSSMLITVPLTAPFLCSSLMSIMWEEPCLVASVSAGKQIRPQNYEMQLLHAGLPVKTAHNIKSNATSNANVDNITKKKKRFRFYSY